MSVTTFAAAQFLRVIPRVTLSRAVGRLCERPLPAAVSRAVTGAYCRAYGVNMQEAEPRASAYPSFDAFFTRGLRSGVREISSDAVVSPADGALLAAGDIDVSARIIVKRRRYDVGELIGDQRDAARYGGGSFAVIYLSPRDYHRVHSPVDGNVVLIRGMPGDLFPVNAIGERYIERLFVRNNRVAIVIETASVGRLTLVMVGAVIVGRISVSMVDLPAVPGGNHPISPARALRKGQEVGVFHLGSTVVLLVEPGHEIVRPPGLVQYGESLLQRAS